MDGLIDSGSTNSFIHPDAVARCSLHIEPSYSSVSMASTDHSSRVLGTCLVKLKMNECEYHDVQLSVLPNLCSDVILGQDF